MRLWVAALCLCVMAAPETVLRHVDVLKELQVIDNDLVANDLSTDDGDDVEDHNNYQISDSSSNNVQEAHTPRPNLTYSHGNANDSR